MYTRWELRTRERGVVGNTVLNLFDACKCVDTAIDGIDRGSKLGLFLLERSNGGQNLLQDRRWIRGWVSVASHCCIWYRMDVYCVESGGDKDGRLQDKDRAVCLAPNTRGVV